MPTDGTSALRAAVVLFLVGLYAAPLFLPPGPAPLLPPPHDASLLERLFPGVPGWWVIGRLLCLLLAGVVAVPMVGAPVFAEPRRRPAPRLWQVLPSYPIAALIVAALHLVSSLWAGELGRPLQLLYIAAFAVPALLLWVGETPSRGADEEPILSPRDVLLVGAVILLWTAWRVPMTWRSLRGIDFIDVSHPYSRLVDAVSSPLNLISDTARQSSIHLVFQGGGLLGADVLLNWGWLQSISMFWIVASAVGVAYLAARMVGREAAPVATAAFLFSPFVLSIPLSIVPLFLGPIFTAPLLLLALAVDRERRPSAIAALGAVAGLAALIPPITPIALVVSIWAAWSMLIKSPRAPFVPLAVAVLSGLAAVLPALPNLVNLQGMASEFSAGRTQWSGLEAELFGQVVGGTEFAIHAGHPGAYDTQVGALLSAFAIPRTAVRLWGDALFDPLGAGLAAVGLIACLAWLRRDRRAALLWVLLVVAFLTAALSSYDRPSFARLVTAPVIVALWAAAGFEVLRRALGGRRAGALGVAVTIAIAAGGGILFDQVNSRILARSAIGLSLSALERTPRAESFVLAPQPWDSQWSAAFAWLVPVEAQNVLPYAGLETLKLSEGAGTPSVLLWTPGMEEKEEVSRAVCEHWPGAALYTLYDDAHLSRAFAACPRGPDWQPALPASQWVVADCSARLETEGSRATDALASAAALSSAGRDAEAVALLRATALRSFIQVRLFETLARAILDQSPKSADIEEAIYWAQRATESKLSTNPGFATLAAAYAAKLDYDGAVAAIERGEQRARDRQDEAGIVEMRELRSRYEHLRASAGRGDS